MSAERYGLVGFAFAFLTWLFAQAVLIGAAAVVGAAIGERARAPHPPRNPPATDPAPAPPRVESPCR